jgi:hypothetical protein
VDIRIRGIKSKCGNIFAFFILFYFLKKRSLCTEPSRRAHQAVLFTAPLHCLLSSETAIPIYRFYYPIFIIRVRSFHRYHRSTGPMPLTGRPQPILQSSIAPQGPKITISLPVLGRFLLSNTPLDRTTALIPSILLFPWSDATSLLSQIPLRAQLHRAILVCREVLHPGEL